MMDNEIEQIIAIQQNYLMVDDDHVKMASAVRYVIMSLLMYAYGRNVKMFSEFFSESHFFKSKIVGEVLERKFEASISFISFVPCVVPSKTSNVYVDYGNDCN